MPRAVLIVLNVVGLAVWLPVAPFLAYVAVAAVYGGMSAGEQAFGLALLLAPFALWGGATWLSWRVWRSGRRGCAVAIALVPLIPGAFYAVLAAGHMPRVA